MACLGQRDAGAAFHRTDAGINGGEHFGRFVEGDAGVEFREPVQNCTPLAVVETGKFVEDFRHAHGRRLQG